jgi:hypothetical protein
LAFAEIHWRTQFWPFTDVLRRIPRCVTEKAEKLATTDLKPAPFPNSLAAILRGFVFYLAVPIS